MISARLSASSSFSPLVSLLKRSLNLKLIAMALAAVTLLGGGEAARAQESAGCSTLGSGYTVTGGFFLGIFNSGEVVKLVSTTGPQVEDTNLTNGAYGFMAVGGTVPISTSGRWSFQGTTPGNFVLSCFVPQQIFTVTNATDTTTGIAANCQTITLSAGSCSLRDALAAAAASTSTGLTVNFDPTVFLTTNTVAQNTITETTATLTVPNNTTVQGLTTGTGASLTNLVTVSGNKTYQVFTVQSGATATISNLTLTNGSTPTQGVLGAGISNAGTLTVNSSTLTGNNAYASGSGIFNSGTIYVNDSTITNNSPKSPGGGNGAAMENTGTATFTNTTIAGNSGNNATLFNFSGSMTITNSTITGNTADEGAGITINTGTVFATNSIIEGNTGSVADPNVFFSGGGGTFTGDSYTLYSVNTATPAYTAATLNLAPLGYYGGPTQTMPVLPTSPAFCNGNPTLTGADQRGVTIPATYGGSTHCVDVGATNSSYSLVFTTQPASSYYAGQFFSPAPVVSFEDDGAVLPATGNVVFVNSGTALTGTASVALSGGAASLGAAKIATAEAGDFLTAVYSLGTSVGNLTANSGNFNIVPSVNHLTLTSVPTTTTAGTAISGTVTAYTSTDSSVVATGYTGPIKITSTDASAVLPSNFSLTNGTGSFSVTLKTTPSQTITAADTGGTPTVTSGSVAVTAASASTISAASGSGKSAVIGAAFTLPLQVQVLDAYSNAISGNVVTFTVPATGASATLSASTCTTDTTGKCSVTATANGTASTTAYSVTAKATGVTTGTTFTLTNNAVTPTLTVTASPTTLVYGQPVTITATSVPLSAGGSYPSGAVTFYDNTTTLTPTSTPSSGVSTYATYALVGSQTYGASSAADTNFSAVAKTTATAIVVSKATPTLSGPVTQPVLVVYGTAGSLPIGVTLPYVPTAVSFVGPSGGLTYTISSPCAVSCTGTTSAISGGGASVPVPSTLASGNYTVTIGYAGDTNFTAATSIQVSVQVGQITPTVTYPAPTAITYGTAITTSNLNATVTYNSNSVASLGTTAYTAVLNGTTTPVISLTAGTVLNAGTYTLTATWTPNSTNSATYKTASGSTTLVVNPAVLTVKANPITILYGQALPAYTAAITGYVNGDTSSVVSGAAALSTTPATPTTVNTYTITPTIGTLAAANYTFTFATGTLTINKASVLVTLAQTAPLPTANGTGVGVPTTFTVSVTDATANSTGTPTGQVLLLSGGTQIGTGTLSGGGTVSISNITFTVPQTALLTAQYVTDGNFAANTSNTVSEVVVTPSLGISANPGSLSIAQGTAGTTTLTFVSVGNYAGTAALSCSGLPANTSCVFGSPALTFTGNDATLTSALSVVTTLPSLRTGAKGGTLEGGLWWMPAILLALLLLRRKRNMAGTLLLLVLTFTTMTMAGCGSSTNLYNTGTPKGSANVTVTITATATGTGSSNLATSVVLPVNVY